MFIYFFRLTLAFYDKDAASAGFLSLISIYACNGHTALKVNQ
jgi:hypothetical protein